MRQINIQGLEPNGIIEKLSEITPGLIDKIDTVYRRMQHHNKREIWTYQAALLYVCAQQYNRPDAQLMEFGTCWGWSAAVIASAAPNANLVTMTPNPNHAKISAGQLSIYKRVKVLDWKSTDLLAQYTGPKIDMLFVDGDHDNVALDMPWWNWIEVGGLMLHHDYTPKGAPRQTPIVYAELERFKEFIGRKPDVLMIDNLGTGMAGWYKRKGDKSWPTQPQQN